MAGLAVSLFVFRDFDADAQLDIVQQFIQTRVFGMLPSLGHHPREIDQSIFRDRTKQQVRSDLLQLIECIEPPLPRPRIGGARCRVADRLNR